MNAPKTTVTELRNSLTEFQKSLLQESWDHFRSTQEWPELRVLYSEHEKVIVTDAMAALKESVCRAQSGPNGRQRLELTLLGAALTKDGPVILDLLKRYFDFQRTIFRNDPKKQSVPDTEVAKIAGLTKEQTALLGRLLSLGHAQIGMNTQEGSWTAFPMDEIEEIQKNEDSSPHVEKWLFRFYNHRPFNDPRFSSLADTSITFVAMWFHKDMEKIWTEGISMGIKDAGYKPLRIDLHQHNNKIDDEIIAKIRECKFLVADFTGQRGGVYYEAGFARALGKEVIWLVNKRELSKVHFDTRQYFFIAWTHSSVKALRKQLQERIIATIGRGPLQG